jgi:hypothetical protein
MDCYLDVVRAVQIRMDCYLDVAHLVEDHPDVVLVLVALASVCHPLQV